ncbi:MAG: 2-amino-4-hydroxy-6-hydroxymethyldihydropteridine diphosphokinase [gamma proteobacterium symbiont of Ctena orbiculata]|nr:MAG: 2-amino-4-hydroxy-6-hydroxymethyldihydropteridine diphosphokinase [gamma proteobacterium symbiont of Ctena orbiculata]PVV19455.1 MAG: 2-amino-4-hydroxy-6-hydroxymethyldihydropteridine diphosphokinase [gamma proteobacterium symbiont of Ctena orbiculata]
MTETGMVNVWLSLGSNMAPENHIPQALHDLEAIFGDLRVSPIYESEAVGFKGDNFHNMVVGISTDRSPRELVSILRQLEARHGRERAQERFNSRTLDIDLLTYGDRIIDEGPIQLPRDEILKYAFVLLPLSEVAADEIHPQTGLSYGQLWDGFDRQDQSLWRVEYRAE